MTELWVIEQKHDREPVANEWFFMRAFPYEDDAKFELADLLKYKNPGIEYRLRLFVPA